MRAASRSLPRSAYRSSWLGESRAAWCSLLGVIRCSATSCSRRTPPIIRSPLQRGPEPSARSVALVLKRALGRLGAFCFRHAALTLVGAAVFAGVAAFGASRLTLDPDLAEL